MAWNKETAANAGKLSKRPPEATTTILREQITGRLDIKKLFTDIEALPPAQSVDARIKLLSLVLPKMQSITATVGLNSLRDLDRMTYEEKLELLKTLNN